MSIRCGGRYLSLALQKGINRNRSWLTNGQIPSKAELYIGVAKKDGAGFDMMRLGHLRFETNEQSSHKARELRSVPVDVRYAVAVRIVAHQNHINDMNIYNQIAFVAVNLVGEHEEMNGESKPPLKPQQPVQANAKGNANASHDPSVANVRYKTKMAAADVSLDVEVDQQSASQIRRLQESKARAVEMEDYDEAKRLKHGINRLREAGAKILSLEQEKQEAVEAEDYDEAKRLKGEIDGLRQAVNSSIQQSSSQPAPVPKPQPAPEPAAMEEADESNKKHERPVPVAAPVPAPAQPPAPEPAEHSKAPPIENEAEHPSYQQNQQKKPVDHDEKPAVGRAAHEEVSAPAKFRGEHANPAPQSRAMLYPEPSSEGQAPQAQYQSNSNEEPEELSSEAEKELGALIPLIGEHDARCLGSRSWELREAALRRTEGKVNNGELGDDPVEVVRAIGRALSRLLKERVPAGFSAAAALATAVGSYGPVVGQREAKEAMGDALAVLADRIGDSNGRIRESASNAMLDLAADKKLGVHAVASHALRQPKSMQQTKLAVGRLQMVRALVEQHGIKEGLTTGGIVQFASRLLDSSSGDVRSEAVSLIQAVHSLVGKQAVQKHLPANLKPQLRAAIDGQGAGQAHQQQPHGAEAKEREKAGAKKPEPPAAAAPQQQSPQQKKSHSPQQQQKQHQQQKQQRQGGEEAMPAQKGKVPVEALHREVEARERQLGKEHADVAAALVELAAALSEEERFEESQGKYERALEIQERELGESHPDTVQTVTDLAICHLDQGRNDLGRPLLERALREQERMLGPQHEDVKAIRDVLVNLDQEDA